MKIPSVKINEAVMQPLVNPQLEAFSKEIQRQVPKFETIEDVYEEKLKRIKSLRTIGRPLDKREYLKLAIKLENCWLGGPCGSAACPECFRLHRLEIIGEVLRLCKKRKNWRGLTLIFYQDTLSDSQLLQWQPDTLIARLRRWLNECGFSGMGLVGSKWIITQILKSGCPIFTLSFPMTNRLLNGYVSG